MFDDPIRVGDLELGELPKRWRTLDGLFQHAVYLRDTRPPNIVCARMIDEARPGGHRLYPTAERYLTAAHDCHRALPALLEVHGATQSAMWSLLRSQFEAAFYALWLLEPEDSAERVLRGVRCEWLDDTHSRRYYAEMLRDAELPVSDQERQRHADEQEKRSQRNDQVYAEEARHLGAKWTRPADVDVVRELGELASSRTIPGGRVLLRHVWRSLAGLQHGDAGALLRVSDRRAEGTSKGGQLLRLSPSDAAFQTIASTTTSLTMTALNQYIAHHQPTRTNGAVDLAHPALFRQPQWNSQAAGS